MKKEYTLQTVSQSGELIEESKLSLEEGSVLIQLIPPNLSISDAANMHDVIRRALENKSPLLTVPYGITFQVLELK